MLAAVIAGGVAIVGYFGRPDPSASRPGLAPQAPMARAGTHGTTAGSRDRRSVDRPARSKALSSAPIEALLRAEEASVPQPLEGAGEGQAPRESAVAEWDRVIAHVIEQKGVPVDEQAMRVKETFDRLDADDQLDAINRALNLLLDEQFPALFDILYDETESADVLDAIFSEALNRPEGIEYPLLKRLREDREHPMFFEASRILDVIEPRGG